MKRFGTQIIGGFFLSALLPPHDDTEPTFYEVLGLDASATDDELRKAYRKLSLKLHPDKIAQRGGDATKKEEAAAKYEKIQEAYHVLIDEKKRLKYNALGSPSRYRFVERGGFADPQSLYENLTSASFRDKSRLVLLFFFIILLVLTQPILIAAKINQVLEAGGGGPLRNTSWFAILIPYYMIGGVFIVLTFVGAFFVPTRDRIPIYLSGFEQIFWYLGIIFLCLKWDGRWDDSVPYSQALIPIYIAMILRWSRSFVILQKVRMDVNRMVTSDYIENEFLKGRSMEDLSEEEQKDIMESFLVVSVDPGFIPDAEGLTVEELEEEKVESSPEYESATDIYNATFTGLSCSLIFGSIFLILLTLKLDDRLNSAFNWWAVFSPFWIERGSRLAINLYKCLCGGISGEEVILYAGAGYSGDNKVDDSNDKESGEKVEDAQDNEDHPKTPSSEVKASAKIENNPILGNDKTDAEIDENEKSKNRTAVSDNEESNSANTGALNDLEKPEDPLAVKNNDGNDCGDDDDINDTFNLDEDTYQAWQSAYQQAEKDTKKERSKSCTDSCVLIFQIMILCLVVSKIDKNFDSTDPYDVGFNVFWILFPFFLIFGISCCCCAMLIFGAAPDKLGEEIEQVELDPENPPTDEIENKGEATNIQVKPADNDDAAVETAVETAVATENQTNALTSVKSEPSDGNMGDLD